MQHEEFEHQTAANATGNERFRIPKCANTLEIAASSSKMFLQIARKTDRTGTKEKQTLNGETIQKHPQNFIDPVLYIIYCILYWVFHTFYFICYTSFKHDIAFGMS